MAANRHWSHDSGHSHRSAYLVFQVGRSTASTKAEAVTVLRPGEHVEDNQTSQTEPD